MQRQSAKEVDLLKAGTGKATFQSSGRLDLTKCQMDDAVCTKEKDLRMDPSHPIPWGVGLPRGRMDLGIRLPARQKGPDI